MLVVRSDVRRSGSGRLHIINKLDAQVRIAFAGVVVECDVRMCFPITYASCNIVGVVAAFVIRALTVVVFFRETYVEGATIGPKAPLQEVFLDISLTLGQASLIQA